MPSENNYHEIPENFTQIIQEFTHDLSNTFPEYAPLWSTWQKSDLSEEEVKYLFKYMVTLYPERFFDIIYQNEDIFKDVEVNTFFLPNVEFKMLYHCTDVTENIRQSIWKYLQLILFSIIGSIKNKDMFGETTNIFDGIDENELHEKLKMTMESLGDFFSKEEDDSFFENFEEDENEVPPPPPPTENSPSSEGSESGQGSESSPNVPNFEEMEDHLNHIGEEAEKIFKNMGKIPGFGKAFKNMDFENMKKNMPKPEELHSHLKSLFDGKIGKLAKDIAEELANDLTEVIDMDKVDANSPKDVLKQLMKNPKKMIELVKNIGTKLNTKMKSGEISQDEIMKEASELFGKMKGMNGGNKEFDEMFKNIAKNMGGLGKNTKMNTGALSNMMKTHSMKERMRDKMEKKRKMMAEMQQMETQFYLQQQTNTQSPSYPYTIVPSSVPSVYTDPNTNTNTNTKDVILEQKDVNYFVYKPEDGEIQEKSVRPTKTHQQNLEEIDKLVMEIQGGQEKTANASSSKKSKKGKK
jgi:hypothetical protein